MKTRKDAAPAVKGVNDYSREWRLEGLSAYHTTTR